MSSKSRDEHHIEKWMFKDPETFVERQAAVRAYKQMEQTLYDYSNPTKMDMVRQFHRNHNIRLDHQMDNAEIADLRFNLIDEELTELGDALDANDKVGVADALGDLLYVIYGAADVYGIDIDRVFAEIHRSNMTKVSTPEASTKIHKIQKGPNYSPPDLSFVLNKDLGN